MADDRPPTIDPTAARRWAERSVTGSPWLHEEVARRMQERLQWIRLQPQAWVHWAPLRGGMAAHGLLQQRYPRATAHVVDPVPAHAATAAQALAPPWWRRAPWRGAPAGLPADGSAQMVWANMALHMSAEPAALMACWHRLLAVDGFLMFSAFGPDTLRELRALYQGLGWPPPAHEFTDMHDWGDMLVRAGFSEPVMDMERIVLTWATPQRLLEELRGLGANLHPQRHAGLRGRRWRERLEQQIAQSLASPAHEGRLALTFEIVYGHALKPAPRARVEEHSAIPLGDMRAMLRGGRPPEQAGRR